jgi:hypothetical protein
LPPAFTQMDWGKLQKNSVSMVGVLAKIQIRHLLNTKWKCHCLSQLAKWGSKDKIIIVKVTLSAYF